MPKTTDFYTCIHCGNTQWFFNAPAATELSGAPEKTEVVEPPKILPKVECQECGATIPENEMKCPECGEDRQEEESVEPEENETAEPTECLSCGGTIPEGQDSCPKSGWSYKR